MRICGQEDGIDSSVCVLGLVCIVCLFHVVSVWDKICLFYIKRLSYKA